MMSIEQESGSSVLIEMQGMPGMGSCTRGPPPPPPPPSLSKEEEDGGEKLLLLLPSGEAPTPPGVTPTPTPRGDPTEPGGGGALVDSSSSRIPSRIESSVTWPSGIMVQDPGNLSRRKSPLLHLEHANFPLLKIRFFFSTHRSSSHSFFFLEYPLGTFSTKKF